MATAILKTHSCINKTTQTTNQSLQQDHHFFVIISSLRFNGVRYEIYGTLLPHSDLDLTVSNCILNEQIPNKRLNYKQRMTNQLDGRRQ